MTFRYPTVSSGREGAQGQRQITICGIEIDGCRSHDAKPASYLACHFR